MYCKNCNKEWNTTNYSSFINNNCGCPRCVHIQSRWESEIVSYIESFYNNKIIIRDRKILNGKEIDIFFPDLKLGFECQGNYWHCNPKFYKKEWLHPKYKFTAEEIWNRDQHKVEQAKVNGVKLIHIWEDDWKNNKKKTQEEIQNILFFNIK